MKIVGISIRIIQNGRNHSVFKQRELRKGQFLQRWWKNSKSTVDDEVT